MPNETILWPSTLNMGGLRGRVEGRGQRHAIRARLTRWHFFRSERCTRRWRHPRSSRSAPSGYRNARGVLLPRHHAPHPHIQSKVSSFARVITSGQVALVQSYSAAHIARARLPRGIETPGGYCSPVRTAPPPSHRVPGFLCDVIRCPELPLSLNVLRVVVECGPSYSSPLN